MFTSLHLKMAPEVGTDLQRGEPVTPPSRADSADVLMVWGHPGTLIFLSHFFFIVIIVNIRKASRGIMASEGGKRGGRAPWRRDWAAVLGSVMDGWRGDGSSVRLPSPLQAEGR